MNRLFSSSEKSLIYRLANGKCQICHCDLPKNWHCDHIIPFSKGGLTALSNAQALCPNCNILKSNYMFKYEPRKWQIEATERFNAVMQHNNVFLLHAGVGSGKTLWASSIVKKYIDDGWDVVIFSPKDQIKKDWARECAKFKVQLDGNYNKTYHWKNSFHGVSLCYHFLKANNNALKSRITKNTIVVLDEHHHSSDIGAWGTELLNVCENAGIVLCLTGTPFRSDNNKIPFVNYKESINDSIDGFEIQTDYSYRYYNSVVDMVCCPTSFRPIDVMIEGVSTLLTTNEHLGHFNAILNANNTNSDFIDTAFEQANKQLLGIKENYKSDAKGLIVANTINDANIIYNKLLSKNISCEIITSDEESKSSSIDEFKKGNKSWVVTVQMITEGVNIPQVRVILYLNNITTRSFFEQVMGRGVRNCNQYSNAVDMCYFYYPNYEPLNKIAETIEAGYKHFVIKQLEDKEPNDGGCEPGVGGCFPPPPKQTQLIFDFISAGNNGIINSDYIFTEKEINVLEKMKSVNLFNESTVIENLFAKRSKIIDISKQEPVVEELPKYEQLNIIKSKIHKAIGRVVHLGLFEKHNLAHYYYNEASGIRDHVTCNDLRLFNKKLTLITNDIDNHTKA